MSRFARERRVFFLEEPIFESTAGEPQWRRTVCERSGVVVLTPILRPGDDPVATQKALLDELIAKEKICEPLLWYYTPMAREFTRHIRPGLIVYDCMDELSAFAGAPAAMKTNEADLFAHADLVFTGGASLYESKRKQHRRVYRFPSSVDVEHFRSALQIRQQPEDQQTIPEPRLGYAGVIDERMDIALVREAAELRPDWHFVFVGPVVKIDPAILPQGPNLHYLGMKPYKELPAYFSGWQIGMLPFALNEATRFISPTKTPEYLAAGLKVVSTPIRDVVDPYGKSGLAGIASNARDFVSVAEELLKSQQSSAFTQKVDAFLSKSSWERTWSEMNELIESACASPATEGEVLAGGAHV